MQTECCRSTDFSGMTIVVVMLVVLSATAVCAQDAQNVVYNRDVRPILSENCFACHGFDPKSREAGLRLDTAEGSVATLESGTVGIAPGMPENSELIRRIFSHEEDVRMPPPHSGKQLSGFQKDILKRWIAQGAEYQKHWAFIAPVQVRLPGESAGPDDSRNPVDAFVRDQLAGKGIVPSPVADPVTLIRRVSLDLTGLPPSVADVDAFVADWIVAPDRAWSQLVDRLLASPHYGERWGRWWLDQARYADSNGYSVDAPRSIWKYRDWVIDALNRDLPFDQFTIEQLAGDLLPEATVAQQVATGFHRNTSINQEGGIDPEQFRIDSVFDRVATTGSVWLGLTIGCAQCHDHKFDPILHKEYYQFFAFFNQQDEPNLTVYPPGTDIAALKAEQKSLEERLTKGLHLAAAELEVWESQLTKEQRQQFSDRVRKALAADREKRTMTQKLELLTVGQTAVANADLAAISAQRDRYLQIAELLESGVTTMVMKERSEARTTNIFIQGDFTRPADVVTSGTPAVLPPLSANGEPINRLSLAKWIVSRENPLTARVIANRIWQQYFGRGLVETENDFGLQGSLPSHPELLDWLAVDLMNNDWSLKSLHRRIVSSATYQQDSRDRDDLKAVDPGNYLLARQRRLRLDAEIVRDVALSACGLLCDDIGGPPVYPPIPAGVMGQGQVRRDWKVSTGNDRYRRGLYTFAYRATPPPLLNVFDAPDGQSSCTRRIRSNTPLQALTLLNDAGFFEFAQALAGVIERDGIEIAFRRCTSRTPSADELTIFAGLEPLIAARVLLNLDETYTRE